MFPKISNVLAFVWEEGMERNEKNNFIIFFLSLVWECGGPFLVESGWAASCGIGPKYSE